MLFCEKWHVKKLGSQPKDVRMGTKYNKDKDRGVKSGEPKYKYDTRSDVKDSDRTLARWGR